MHRAKINIRWVGTDQLAGWLAGCLPACLVGCLLACLDKEGVRISSLIFLEN